MNLRITFPTWNGILSANEEGSIVDAKGILDFKMVGQDIRKFFLIK